MTTLLILYAAAGVAVASAWVEVDHHRQRKTTLGEFVLCAATWPTMGLASVICQLLGKHSVKASDNGDPA